MDIRFQNASGGGWAAACTLVFAVEDKAPEMLAPDLWARVVWLGISPGLRDFKGKQGEAFTLFGHPDNALPRVYLVGLGKSTDLKVDSVRRAVAKAMQALRSAGHISVGLVMEQVEALASMVGCSREELLKECVVAAKVGLYRLETFKSKKQDEEKDPEWLGIMFSEAETPEAARLAARVGEAEAEAVLYARNLGNSPANYLTPRILAEEAAALGKKYGFSCQVHDEVFIQEQGMGALWAVARGSVEPPRFIVLEYAPQGKEEDAPIVFVGKGITFDSGGISLKPGLNMHEMKADMGGAAAVLGFFKALGEMPDKAGLPRIIGVIPAAENMPGGHATRPGDVVTTLSGQTVEILNTDAEGRLILCDALTYAQREWKPKALINAATLTGACVVALGDYATGLFTKDEKLQGRLMNAAQESGDLFWPLPLWEQYDANLKSPVADIPNIGPREGGALFAALFLQRFIDEVTPWAHLDIAGPSYVVKTSELHPVPGATGVGVRVFCAVARSFGKG